MPGFRSFVEHNAVALWIGLASFLLFCLFGAFIGPVLLFTATEEGFRGILVWPIRLSLSLICDLTGTKSPDTGLFALSGALAYGFIGFDLWLLGWLVYRAYRWGFSWRP